MSLWTPLGILFLAIGAVGVVLPVLPTTPFVLLAAGCFARSSPRLHAWLMNNRVFGPILLSWEENRCISRKTKIFALSTTLAAGGASLCFFVPPGWPQLAAGGLIAIGCGVIISLPVSPPSINESHAATTGGQPAPLNDKPTQN